MLPKGARRRINVTYANRRNGLKIVGILAAAALVVGACSGSATPSPSAAAASAAAPSAAASTASAPLFVAINKSADQQYFIDQQNAFKAEIEAKGGQVKLYNAKLDANTGISEVNDAISAGAKGIAITVPDQTIGPAVAKAAADAKVALVATDDAIKDGAGAAIPFVGFSGSDMGNKVGDEAATLLATAGWLKDSTKKVGVLSVEVQTLSVCNDRTTAEKAKIQAAGATNVYPVPYSGEIAAAQTAAGPIITAHPDITNWVVFACNDEGVQGTVNALATAGVANANIIAVGLGAYQACKPWAAKQDSAWKAALFISGLDVGKASADALWANVVDGTPLPASTIANTTIVDPTNFATVMDKLSVANCSK
jgi:L-arabinose transport system substrate-binding protein